MKKFEEQKFNIPALKGISAKNIEEHLKLYAGYVKNTNLILERIAELTREPRNAEKHLYELGELQRRFAFEFDGMRNHEYYFRAFEGGPKTLSDGELKKAIAAEWGSFDDWLARFKTVALTRGIGWAMFYFDKKAGRLLNGWVDEQHSGHLTGLAPVLALDMWEHSYVMDYLPSGKKNYVEDFFANLNWSVAENNYADIAR